jgi:hypothetical protein
MPAEILDRTILDSTDGPIEHCRIACLGGHRFLMPTAMLPERQNLQAARGYAVAGTTWVEATPGERWAP